MDALIVDTVFLAFETMASSLVPRSLGMAIIDRVEMMSITKINSIIVKAFWTLFDIFVSYRL